MNDGDRGGCDELCSAPRPLPAAHHHHQHQPISPVVDSPNILVPTARATARKRAEAAARRKKLKQPKAGGSSSAFSRPVNLFVAGGEAFEATQLDAHGPLTGQRRRWLRVETKERTRPKVGSGARERWNIAFQRRSWA